MSVNFRSAFPEAPSFRDCKLKSERGNRDRPITPPDRLEATESYESLLMRRRLVNFRMNTCDAFEQTASKGSGAAIGNPARHCRHRFHEQIFKNPPCQIRVVNAEIEVAGSDVDSTKGQTARPVEKPT